MEVQTRDGLYGFEFRENDLRRSEPGERKVYNIKALWQRNHEIVNLAARGFKHTEIAEILGIHPSTVGSTINSDLGKHKLSDIRYSRDEETKKVSEKIRVLTNKALDVYHEIFDDEDTPLKDKKAAADTVVLELSGLRAPTRIQSVSSHIQITAEELAAVKQRALAACAEAGKVIDISPKETEVDDLV